MEISRLTRILLCFGLLSAEAAQPEGGLEQHIGSLYNMDGDSCVATLLNDSLVLTAAHCLFDEMGRSLDPAEFSFQRQQEAFHTFSAYTLHPDFNALDKPSISTIATDLALLRLKRPIIGVRPLPQGGPVFADEPLVLGFPQGLAPCRIAGQTGSVLALDCHIVLGNSGAPVLRERFNAPGRYEVVAVVSAFETSNNAQTAIAGEILFDLSDMATNLSLPD